MEKDQGAIVEEPLGPPDGHLVASGNREDGRIQFDCQCGAKWSVSQRELERGVDHIEDHWRYARKIPTRVD